MVAGMKFLSKKGFNPQNMQNQEKVWIAEQRKAAEESKTKELARQIQLEREREELDRLAGKKTHLDRGIDWMYQGQVAGGDSKPSELEKQDAENRAEEFLLGKEYVAEGAAQGDFAQASGAAEGVNAMVKLEDNNPNVAYGSATGGETSVAERNEAFRQRVEDPMFMVSRKEREKRIEAGKQKALFERVMGPVEEDDEEDPDRHEKKKKKHERKRERKERRRSEKEERKRKRRDDEEDRERKRHHHRRRENSDDDESVERSRDRRHSSRKRDKYYSSDDEDSHRGERRHHRSSSRRHRSRSRSRSRDNDRKSSRSSSRRYRSRSRSPEESSRHRHHHRHGSDHHYSSGRHHRDYERKSYNNDRDDPRGSSHQDYRSREEKPYNPPHRDGHAKKEGYGLQGKSHQNSGYPPKDLGPAQDLLRQKRQTVEEERRRTKERASTRRTMTAEERAQALQEMQATAQSRSTRDTNRPSSMDDEDAPTRGKANFIKDMTEQAHGIKGNSHSLVARMQQNRNTQQRLHDDSFL